MSKYNNQIPHQIPHQINEWGMTKLERYLGLIYSPAFSHECERAPHDTNIALKLERVRTLHFAF